MISYLKQTNKQKKQTHNQTNQPKTPVLCLNTSVQKNGEYTYLNLFIDEHGTELELLIWLLSKADFLHITELYFLDLAKCTALWSVSVCL